MRQSFEVSLLCLLEFWNPNCSPITTCHLNIFTANVFAFAFAPGQSPVYGLFSKHWIYYQSLFTYILKSTKVAWAVLYLCWVSLRKVSKEGWSLFSSLCRCGHCSFLTQKKIKIFICCRLFPYLVRFDYAITVLALLVKLFIEILEVVWLYYMP